MPTASAYTNQRRQVEAHHEALVSHQKVLQQHAQLHQVQAQAREALRAELQAHTQRTFAGRLRWLLIGT